MSPQGSNLGPLLILLCINDFPNCLDETQASIFAHEVENMINTHLEDLHKWLLANKLTLNEEKTECMLVNNL